MWLKLLIVLIIIPEIIYLSLCLALYTWQKRLIFLPTSIIEITPAQQGIPYEDVWLNVSNQAGINTKIHGWWLPNEASSDVLLYLHGNGANISANLGIAQRFYQGFSVLLIDYRGYGRSEGGFPSEAKVYKDAQIAWNYLVEQRKIKPEQIFVYGHSLGGAIAIDLAVRQPQMAGLIVESSFTSIAEIGVYYGGIYRLLPKNILINQRFDSLSKVPLLKMPVLFIHGTNDVTVPYYMSEQLFAATTAPKKLLIVPEAGHNNTSYVAEAKYIQTVRDFISFARSFGLKEIIER